MSERTPPFFRITDDDHGGVAVVAALCMIIITLAIGFIRYIVASRHKVKFQHDDASFYLASILAVISSICIFRAVLVGLGRRIDAITPKDLVAYYKLMYTSQLFGILSMGSAKVSVVLLFKRIAPTAEKKVHIALAMCATWTVFSFLGTAFQCQVPSPWVYVPSKCSSHGYLQFPIIILNIVTDAILSLAILPTVWGLNMPRDTRTTVMTLFGLRLSVCIIAIGQLVAVAKSRGNHDQTWVNLTPAVWLMTINHLSVVTATIPRTHSFWASLRTGKANTEITAQEYELSSNSKSSPFGTRADESRNQKSKVSKNSKNDHSLNWSKSREEDPNKRDSKVRFRPTQSSIQDGPPLERTASQEPLRLTPNHNAELTTRIYSEQNGGDIVISNRDDDDASQSSIRHPQPGTGNFGVWQEREIRVEVEYENKRQK